MTSNVKARALRDRLAKGEVLLAPGIYDGISARVADRMGFPALYMTGYGATASMLGLPDAGLATYSDMVGRAEMICSVVDVPRIAAAHTGYGGLLNVQRTVRGYEAAGVAAIQIEDQEMPKKCGHTPGRRAVPAEDMVLKIRGAAEARGHRAPRRRERAAAAPPPPPLCRAGRGRDLRRIAGKRGRARAHRPGGEQAA